MITGKTMRKSLVSTQHRETQSEGEEIALDSPQTVTNVQL